MMKFVLGRKVGMTQVFSEEGEVTPVTVIEIGKNEVAQLKTTEKDGYEAVQVGYDEKKESRTVKPEKGHFDKAGITPKKFLREFRVEKSEEFSQGQEITAATFAAGDKVDIIGTSKGKGFQGNIKRHNQSRGPETHGSRYHRRPGSMGASADPARVFKGKNLPGQMGNERVTVRNLEIVKVLEDKNVILIKGAVPGPKKGLITIKETIKQGK
ncbi:50S ribosomal protein L3 [Isachenkonia alkalipeptolytica]|uniref:Large ribosomal subunit protein uL3 n=1 Tax=Isachenkonia alkalipeptolytica TaxID=2565777 RepID=A0AA43XN84_9CLOT|nr:50S ribosomal protein L3 [Isachenkonia alkalipeptolytica]